MEGATEAHRHKISGSRNTMNDIIFIGCWEESKNLLDDQATQTGVKAEKEMKKTQLETLACRSNEVPPPPHRDTEEIRRRHQNSAQA